jgi:apolipoprotein N-acyltransferase
VTGEQEPVNKNQGPETKNQWTVARNQKPMTSDRKPETGNWRPVTGHWLLVPCSALLLLAALYVAPLSFLAFVAFVPALMALEGRPPKAWAMYGALLCYLTSLGNAYWIYHVTHVFGGLPPSLSVVTVILFAGLNIWSGFFGFFLFRSLSSRVRLPPSLLFAIVFGTVWHTIPALFFWDLAVLVHPIWWLAQSLDLFGGFGLDLFILAANYAIYEAIRARRVTRAVQVCAVLLILLCGYGVGRSYLIARQMAAAPKIRIAMVQPNLDSGAKADRNYVSTALQQLTRLTNEAMTHNPDFLVWPESTFPIDYQRDPQLRQRLDALVSDWDRPLFFGGSHAKKLPSGDWQYFNIGTLVEPGALTPQLYAKHVLLAFGEYIPLEHMIPQIRDWLPQRIGRFGRGKGPSSLRLSTFRFAPAICYESIVKDHVRGSAQLDVDFLVEITNGGWFGTTPALRFHKDLTLLRAIENRLTIARDTNSGITTVIDPIGNEVATLPVETPAVSIHDIAKVRPFSLYTQGGYLLQYAVGLWVLCLVLIGWQTKPRDQ